MKAYLAAPIFTERDRMFNSYLESEILKLCPNLDLYLAQNNKSINDKTGCANSADIYVGDITRLKESDLLITIMSGDLPPIGSSYEVAYFCGLCEQDPKRRIIALYDDCREASHTFSNEKVEAMISGIAENQFSYINLLAVGFVKKWGDIYFNSKDFIQAIKKEYDIGCENHISGIYSITNLKNGLVYIGQSKDIYRRWREHSNKSSSQYDIQFAINKYGKDYFRFKVIEKCDEKDLIERESYWINYYNSIENGYNKQFHSTDFNNIPPWHNKKVYQYSLDGKFINEFETIIDAAISINRSTAGINKCLKYNDSNHSSGGFMWREKFEENIPPYKKLISKAQHKIYKYNLETRLYEGEYDSLAEAVRDLGYTSIKTHIPDVIKGKRKHCYGYLWANEYFDRLPENYYKEVGEFD